MLLEEFDPVSPEVLLPAKLYQRVPGMPRVAVSCFSHTTFQRMVERLNAVQIAEIHSANMTFPIYKAQWGGAELALMMAAVGAPLCTGQMEELYALGVESLVVFGTCGVLNKDIADCSIILPTHALRDEGTSYHYAPAGDDIAVNTAHRALFEGLLDELKIHYTTGKTWTTDAIYRETREKVRRRREAGCICVEMECAALAAMAQLRGKELLTFFYAADNLDREEWDPRSLSNHARLDDKDRVCDIALELAGRVAAQKA